MKTIFITLLVSAISISLMGNSKFEKAMGEALVNFEKSKSMDELKSVEAQFSKIAAKEKKEWLPFYFSSLVNCILSFQTADYDEKNALIEKAQMQLDVALKIKENESELYTLQGMIYQATIMMDLPKNGPIYAEKSIQAFRKAIELNPKNPRPHYLQGVSMMFTPEQFGGGKQVAIPHLERAVELFRDFAPKSRIYPTWGKEDCQRQLENCRKG